MDEIEDVTAYAVYRWDCPACGTVNEGDDVEPVGQNECADCGNVVNITGSM